MYSMLQYDLISLDLRQCVFPLFFFEFQKQCYVIVIVQGKLQIFFKFFSMKLDYNITSDHFWIETSLVQ